MKVDRRKKLPVLFSRNQHSNPLVYPLTRMLQGEEKLQGHILIKPSLLVTFKSVGMGTYNDLRYHSSS
jgi:hypothetical protein